MNGRRSKLVVSMLAIAILAVATAPLFAADHTHQMKGTIVSVDATAKTITFKDKDGQEHTSPVLGKAVDNLASLKAGQHVTLTCTDSDNGDHLGISAIKVSTSHAK